jgi:hypothetical protein
MAQAPRLKVYRARMGFFESVVAARSQKAALEAWGTRQDLFAEGMASLIDDAAAVAAAQAHPGQPLQRPIGSDGPFEAPSTSAALPAVPPPPVRKSIKRSPPDAKPDRGDLGKAEAALARLDHEQQMALVELERSRQDLQRALQALDARELDLRRRFESRRRQLETALDRARKSYERAGGQD